MRNVIIWLFLVCSTIYVDKDEYAKHQHDKLKDYKSFKAYKNEAYVHRNFDVYSVGIILKEILSYYGRDDM